MPAMDEDPKDCVPVKENPPTHEKVIPENDDVENVEEVKQEEGGQDETIGIPPIDQFLAQQNVPF